MLAQPHTLTPDTSGFTCNACAIQFPVALLQRQHMRTDWHRYNLKRRVAQLGPILAEVFAAKVSSVAATEQAEDEDEFGFVVHQRRGAGPNKQTTKKDLRRQRQHEERGRVAALALLSVRDSSPALVVSSMSAFSLALQDTEGTHETRLDVYLSGEEEAGPSEDSGYLLDSGLDDTDTEEHAHPLLQAGDCLFCPHHSASPEASLEHMRLHGLYVPHADLLADAGGLVQRLVDHVNDVLVGDEDEESEGEPALQRYNCINCHYRGRTLEAIRLHMVGKGHHRFPYDTREERDAMDVFFDFDRGYDAGVEADAASTAESIDVDDSGYTTVAVHSSGVELTLPTGSRIGHRLMDRYYRQHLTTRLSTDGEATVAVADKRFSHLVGAVVPKEVKQARVVERRVNLLYAKRKFGENKKGGNLQKHFFDPNTF